MAAKRRIILITGSRNWTDRAAIQDAITQFKPTLLVHGDARGADAIAHEVAMSAGIDVARFPANWNGRGKAAGAHRNRLMFDLMIPTLVLAFPLADSIGTWDMVKYARSCGCDVLVKGEDF